MFQRTNVSVCATALCIALTACGGGGGGGGGGGIGLPMLPTTGPAPAPAAAPPAPAPAPAPAPSAPAGSEELAAFTLLNKERLNCGFGALSRSSQLDVAARGHANWMLVNNATGHGQTPDSPGFTGASPYDRITAAGYTPSTYDDENMDIGGRSKATGFGEISVRALLSAPYHLGGMVSGYHDVGVSVMSSDDVGTTSKFKPRVVAQFDLANTFTTTPQAPAAGTVLTYPCDGTTGTFTMVSNESPNPVPGRNLATSPIGQAIYLAGDAGKVLRITSALLQEKSTGNTLALLAPITGSTDANKVLKSNEAIVIPDAPLKVSTQYLVTIVGENDGTSFTKNFSFTTGALAQAQSAGN